MSKRNWSSCEKTRNFRTDWEQLYFFTPHSSGDSSVCLICSKVVTGFKKSNLQRHFQTNHESYDQQYPRDSEPRRTKLRELKHHLTSAQACFTKFAGSSARATAASFAVSEVIAKHKKPFADGEYIKQAALALVENACSDLPAKDEIIRRITDVPLSGFTVARRTTDIAHDIFRQLVSKIKECDFFSLAFDESTDAGDTAQLCIFARIVKGLEVCDELLALLPLKGRTTGEVVSDAIIEFLQKWDLPLDKLISVTTDGAPSMLARYKGCTAVLRKSGLFPNLQFSLHCLIHQENLCSRAGNLDSVMSFVTTTINFIKKSSSLAHRQFKQLLQEADVASPDLLLHSDVRWLSRSLVLQRFL